MRPPKPIKEMTKAEFDAFTKGLYDTMVARYKAAREQAEREIAEEEARSKETAEKAGTEAGGEDTDR